MHLNTRPTRAAATGLLLLFTPLLAPAASGEKSAHFDAVSSQLELGGDLFAYVDISGDIDRIADLVAEGFAAYFAMSEEPVPVSPGVFKAILGTLGVSGLDAVGVSSVKDGALYRNTSFLYMSGGRKGLFEISGGEPHPFEAVEMAPAGTIYLYETDLNLKVVLTLAEQIAQQALGAFGAGQLQRVVDQPFQPGMPTIRELVEKLDTRLTLIVTRGEGTIALPNGGHLPKLDALVAVEGLGVFLDKLRPLAEGSGAVNVTDVTGALTFSIAEPLPGELGYWSPELSHDKGSGRLYFTTRGAFRQECLAKPNGLAATEAFRVATRNLPEEGNAFAYISGDFIDTYLSLIFNLQGARGGGPGAEEKLIKDMMGFFYGDGSTGNAAVMVNREDGLLSVQNSTVSLKTVLAIMPAAMMGAVALPAYARAEAMSERNAAALEAARADGEAVNGAAIGGPADAPRTGGSLGAALGPHAVILRNLRQISASCDQFFIEEGKVEARQEDIIGADKYLKALPASVAGEDYSGLFPVKAGFESLTVTTSDGTAITYQ